MEQPDSDQPASGVEPEADLPAPHGEVDESDDASPDVDSAEDPDGAVTGLGDPIGEAEPDLD